MDNERVISDPGLQFPGRDLAYDPRRVTRIRHGFSSHPLMQLEQLEELAVRLHRRGAGQLKYLAKGTPANAPFDTLTQDEKGRGIREVFSSLGEPGSWIALYHVASDPQYREFVWQVVRSIQTQIDASDPGVFEVDGFIFLSSPPSATPFHIDRENNFFLQIRGRKRFSVWHPDDRAVVSERALEQFIAHFNLDEVRLADWMIDRCAFNGELTAGEGVYMPSTSPHMSHTEHRVMSPEESISISIGVVFFTRATRRAAYNYALNAFMRRLGLASKPPYQSAVRDRLKYPPARLYVQARKLLGSYSIPWGF